MNREAHRSLSRHLYFRKAYFPRCHKVISSRPAAAIMYCADHFRAGIVQWVVWEVLPHRAASTGRGGGSGLMLCRMSVTRRLGTHEFAIMCVTIDRTGTHSEYCAATSWNFHEGTWQQVFQRRRMGRCYGSTSGYYPIVPLHLIVLSLPCRLWSTARFIDRS